MKPEKKNELRAAVAAIVEEGRQRVGAPPSEELLLAYSRGELSEHESDRVQELLSHYPESVRLLADLVALEPAPDDPDYLSEEELEKDWRALQEKLDRSAGSAEALGEDDQTATPPLLEVSKPTAMSRVVAAMKDLISGEGAVWRAAAAAGWVIAISLLLFPPSAGQPTEPYVQKQIGVYADGRRGAGAPQRLMIQEGQSTVPVLGLVDPVFDRYRLELHAAGESQAAPLWSQSGLSPDEDDAFPVVLPPGFVRPGRYEFRLYGVNEEGEKLEATYTVEFWLGG